LISDVIVNGKCTYPKKKINRHRNITTEETEYWKELQKEGLTIAQIGEKVGRHPTQIKYYLTTYEKPMNNKAAKIYIMKNYNSKYKEYYRIVNNKSQIVRYKNDLDYRFYQACNKLGCKNIKKNYGSLENYYKYRKLLFEAEKDPKITKEQYKEFKSQMVRRFKIA